MNVRVGIIQGIAVKGRRKAHKIHSVYALVQDLFEKFVVSAFGYCFFPLFFLFSLVKKHLLRRHSV